LVDEYVERKSLFARMKDTLFGVEEPDDEDYDDATAGTGQAAVRTRMAPSLRLQTARSGRVAVRLNAQVFEDAKLAADGLKGGEYQLVNLERATPQMAERIIDFLNGVCYALDGTVERVGEKVYMFVPANVAVEVDNGATAAAAAARRSPFVGE
jgi:cell division inhibitor SepF